MEAGSLPIEGKAHSLLRGPQRNALREMDGKVCSGRLIRADACLQDSVRRSKYTTAIRRKGTWRTERQRRETKGSFKNLQMIFQKKRKKEFPSSLSG